MNGLEQNTDFPDAAGLYLGLTMVVGRAERAIAEDLRQFGMEPEHWRVLAVLKQNSGVSVRELSDLAGVERTTLSRLLTRWEAAGWLRRSFRREDARAFRLQLTPEGEAAIRRSAPYVAAAAGRVLADMAPVLAGAAGLAGKEIGP